MKYQRVFIAEKPELARAIVDGLEAEYGLKASQKEGYYEISEDVVTYCFGHILTLCDPEDYDPALKKWDFSTLPIFIKNWKKKPIDNKKKQLNIIANLVKSSKKIVHAGDPDEEGQLIIDEVIEYLGAKQNVERLLINDINTKVVQKALQILEPNEKYKGLYLRGLARALGDQLYGYNLTRAFTLGATLKGDEGVKPVGRVQTPILGLIVRRDREHENHIKKYYFDLTGEFQVSNLNVVATFKTNDTNICDDKGRLISKEEIKNIISECEGKQAVIKSVESKEKIEFPPLPYNLLTLQVEANKKFGYTADNVLKITQALRENFRLISYNRSDCQYIKEENFIDAPEILNAILEIVPQLDDAINNASTQIKSKAFNTQNVSAHGAIIPTGGKAEFNKLSEEQQNIYLLIAKRYILQFYPPYKFLETTVNFNFKNYTFLAISRTPIDDGWKKAINLWNEAKNKDESQEADNLEENINFITTDLSSLQKGTITICTKININNKETKPPSYYTEASLLLELRRIARHIKDPRIRKLLEDKDKDKKNEHGGIGTPATRSTIFENLKNKGLIKTKGKSLISTESGRIFFDSLPEEATVPDMTALWHEQQIEIEQGKKKLNDFLNGLMEYITKVIENIKKEGLNLKINLDKCPVCNEGVLKLKYGKDKSAFFGCSNYPSCKATFNVNKDGKADIGEQCPKCKVGYLKKIKGTKNAFFACNNQECKTTFSIDKKGCPELSTFFCKVCNKPLIKRLDKNKKNFWWGCSGFKDGCKTTYNDKNGEPDF